MLSEHVELDGPLESLEPLLFILSPMLETLLRQAINHAYALAERDDHAGSGEGIPASAWRFGLPFQYRAKICCSSCCT